MKIYVASSWRNEEQPWVIKALRNAGHEVYDFRNPGPGKTGFAWSEIDPNWEHWTNEQFIAALNHPIAHQGFQNDYEGMMWADACVLLMPCGCSAHVEAGWMQGNGKPTIVLVSQAEPELMYKLFERVAANTEEVLEHLALLEMCQDTEDFYKNDPEPISLWFELSRAEYLTIPRSVMQAMPQEWQVRMAECLQQLDDNIDWRPKEGGYWVGLKDENGRYLHDPLRNYRHPLPGTIKFKKTELQKERTCRVCGCTDRDCRQCVEKTGSPCHWVSEDLCSACV